MLRIVTSCGRAIGWGGGGRCFLPSCESREHEVSHSHHKLLSHTTSSMLEQTKHEADRNLDAITTPTKYGCFLQVSQVPRYVQENCCEDTLRRDWCSKAAVTVKRTRRGAPALADSKRVPRVDRQSLVVKSYYSWKYGIGWVGRHRHVGVNFKRLEANLVCNGCIAVRAKSTPPFAGMA